jgi:hypothetical protein
MLRDILNLGLATGTHARTGPPQERPGLRECGLLFRTYAHSVTHQAALIHAFCSGRSNSNIHSLTMQLNPVKWLKEMGRVSGSCALCRMERAMKPLGSHETLGLRLRLRQDSSRTDAKPPGLVFEAKNRRRLWGTSGGRRDIRW